jgi:hypothetical protein
MENKIASYESSSQEMNEKCVNYQREINELISKLAKYELTGNPTSPSRK